ncbi:ATP-dependent helicase [Candidatus Kaiserbacteria bacterium CG10_big_fil_rev_8_21_14_0_10_59_10]|uniref:ATP-dependent helicase n=1 Tax=Candidatus Kaiserbacteria bacterium CG10_big_fil_rev_8_21_14_0_10_59_10 TaxID=1974612 RepID=A0A2H0U7I9_9BACT|nr:MAG: ATP-dependent helicase [Candidatus Kaiserbacteria bacterium CG10_big_fil_rev_8_21_14_0_10_59_10]
MNNRRHTYASASHGRARGSGRGGRPSYGHGRARQHGRSGAAPQDRIDISRFIHKAVIIEEAEVFTPKHSFMDFNIDPRIKHNIGQKGYATPTPIQDSAIPHILAGRDLVGIANTGTGKTGAFLIPLLDKVVRQPDERVLIMVPTRELAQQIDEEYRGFSSGSGIASVCTVGGANINPQIQRLRRKPYFVIGTPGRIKDLIERRALDLSAFGTVVLDEADRMLDMGFIHDMRTILALMPKKRQTLFFSATLSSDIEKLIGDFLNEPVRVSVKTGDTAKGVDQDIVRLGGKNKLDVLHDLLAQPEFGKVLIFGRTKHGVERLSKMLVQRGFKAASIHGNKTQAHRQRALGAFKQDDIRILVATDVAARGIDIADVSHVINYDLPTTYDDYVHRIGRTGRAGKRGKALTFIE